MADLSIGVIGAGGMGSRHALNLHSYVKGAHVAAIYDLDQPRAEHVAAACGSARAFSDPLSLIQDASVDAVLIASPDPTHAEFVHACLQHHKPVLCEKPLATTAKDALQIVEAEQALISVPSSGPGKDLAPAAPRGKVYRPNPNRSSANALGRRLIAVGFMRRFDPQHVAVRQVVAAGDIGRPILFKGVHRNPMFPPHLPGTAVVTNSAIHDIDSARWLLGQEITEVYVRGVRTHTSFSDEMLDMLLIQMALSGQCLGIAEVSVAVEYGYEVLAEIVGERGSALTISPGFALVRAHDARSVVVPQSHLVRFQEAYISELTAWVQSIQTGQLFTGANTWDGYMSLLVADACIRSLESGSPVAVSTPTKPALYQERG